MNSSEQNVIARRIIGEAMERVDAVDALLSMQRAQLAAERQKLHTAPAERTVLVSAPMLFASAKPAAA